MNMDDSDSIKLRPEDIIPHMVFTDLWLYVEHKREQGHITSEQAEKLDPGNFRPRFHSEYSAANCRYAAAILAENPELVSEMRELFPSVFSNGAYLAACEKESAATGIRNQWATSETEPAEHILHALEAAIDCTLKEATPRQILETVERYAAMKRSHRAISEATAYGIGNLLRDAYEKGDEKTCNAATRAIIHKIVLNTPALQPEIARLFPAYLPPLDPVTKYQAMRRFVTEAETGDITAVRDNELVSVTLTSAEATQILNAGHLSSVVLHTDREEIVAANRAMEAAMSKTGKPELMAALEDYLTRVRQRPRVAAHR